MLSLRSLFVTVDLSKSVIFISQTTDAFVLQALQYINISALLLPVVYVLFLFVCIFRRTGNVIVVIFAANVLDLPQ